MIYHIVIGDAAAAPLMEAISMEAAMEGEVVTVRDVLNIGPLQKEEGQKFSELRSAFWNTVIPNDKTPIQVDDMERLLELSAKMANDEEAKVWLWMAPWPADVCTYFWTLKYLGKYPGRFYIVNIAGLPFLDANGKVFFPKNLSEIAARELIKARRLARQITPAELEVDGDEWQRLVNDNAGIRTLEGGKKIASRAEDHYDSQLSSFCSHQFQKASKVVTQSLAKYNLPTGDLYLGWRLRRMADAGKLELQGDTAKALKDFEVKLPGDGSNAQYSLAL
jgi:Protein of unknown function/Domain of unknown function (DUF1835)